MTFCEQSKQRLARDLRHRVPYRHVDGADSHRALAVAARFLVRHQHRPDFIRVEVFAAFVEQSLRVGFHQAWREPFSDQPTLSVTAVRVEAVTDDRLALAHDIGDDGNKARRHLCEIDIGVADRRGDRFCDFADLEDTNGHGFPLSKGCSVCHTMLAWRSTGSGRGLVAEIRFYGTVDLDGERVAKAIFGVTGGHAHPSLAHAIFFDVGFLDSLEANADIACQHLFIVVRAFRIDGQTIRQLLSRNAGFLVHSKASISFLRRSGVTVGACRATTLPDRSTRNLVKFHLIDEPNSPDFAFFKCWYNGCALPPLTSILANMGKLTAYLLEQNCSICLASPVSWFPN